jgi:glycosyltransferase involved in cell wall biosynthesis
MHCVDMGAANRPLEMLPHDVSAPSNELPVVSVIIPVKNDAARLAVCLSSLNEQAYPTERYEVIVVDNGSSDDSAEMAIKHGAKLLQYPGILVGALRNRGVEQARGEVLAFVDSDHETPPTWLLSGASELHRQLGTRMVGSPCLAPSAGTWVQRGWEKHRLRRRDRHETRWLGAGNMFLRRSDFLAAGGFREDLVAGEDVDLCLRLAALPGRIVNDLGVANIHHGEPATLFAFFQKEYWRGTSGLRAFVTQGMPIAELPTLLYPAYHLVAAISVVIAIVYAIWFAALLPLVIALLLLLLPGLFLAAKTSWQRREFTALAPLFVLYVTYGLARAAALFR